MSLAWQETICGPSSGEAFADQRTVLEVDPRRHDQVHRVEMGGEGRPVDRVDEPGIAVDAVGQRVLHHLERKSRPSRPDPVDHQPDRLDRGVEGFLAHVHRVRRVVGSRSGRADVTDRAPGADGVGDREAVAGVVEVRGADLGLRRHQIAPDADLGEHDVGLAERLLDRGEAGGVADLDRRDVGGAVAEVAVRPGEGRGVVGRDVEAVAPEADHRRIIPPAPTLSAGRWLRAAGSPASAASARCGCRPDPRSRPAS